MSNIIRLSIDVTKLDKKRFFNGQKGTYCDLVLIPRREISEKGETHIVKQEVTKEERQSGNGPEMPIVGNAKERQEPIPANTPRAQGFREQRSPMPANRREAEPISEGLEDDEIPF